MNDLTNQQNQGGLTGAEKALRPEAIPALPVGASDGKLGKQGIFAKILWILIAIASAIYIVFPEPSDAIPILGWLDEGLAFILLSTALSKLGVKIPILDRFLNKKAKK